MDELESHSSDRTSALRQFFTPTWVDIILYILIGGVWLTLLNFHTIWTRNDTAAVSPSALSQLLGQKFSSLGAFLGLPLFGKISLLLFWAFIGCVAYMLLWLVQYGLITLHEDIAETTYIHPGSFSESGYWRSVIAHNIFLVCAIFVSIAYAAGAIKIFFPLLAKVFIVGLFDFPHAGAIFDIILSLLISGLVVYVAVILWRILRGIWGLNKVPEE